MAKATNNYEEAEDIIRKIIYGSNIEKTLDICRWLFSFNEKERHKVKFYQSYGKTPDARFCIDRGGDCDGINIRTGFLIIESNFSIDGLYTKNANKYHYYKTGNQTRCRINSSDALMLTKDMIREHLMESYLLKADDMGLPSIIRNDYDISRGSE